MVVGGRLCHFCSSRVAKPISFGGRMIPLLFSHPFPFRRVYPISHEKYHPILVMHPPFIYSIVILFLQLFLQRAQPQTRRHDCISC